MKHILIHKKFYNKDLFGISTTYINKNWGCIKNAEEEYHVLQMKGSIIEILRSFAIEYSITRERAEHIAKSANAQGYRIDVDEFCIKSKREPNGMRKRQLEITIPEQLHSTIQKCCKSLGCSRSLFVCKMIERGIRQR